jgi:hypothetical protein
MKIYLIDTENVSYHWMDKIKLKNDDKIILFYTCNTSHIPYLELERMSEKLHGKCIKSEKKKISYKDIEYLIVNNNVPFEMIECSIGKNALDFQLVSYLGMLIFENPDAEFIIVSDDHGFDAVVSMWSKKQIFIRRYSVSEKGEKSSAVIKIRNKTSIETISELKKKKNEVENIIKDILNEEEPIISKTTDFFIKYYVYNKEVFLQSLKSTYGKEKGEKLNKKIEKNAKKILDLAA